MAKRRSSRTQKSSPEPSPSVAIDPDIVQLKVADSIESTTERRAALAVLVYLCGDNHVRPFTDTYLDKLLASTPCQNIHLVIQYDTAQSAKRYIVRAGERWKPDSQEEIRRDVNTGDPRAFDEFMAWSLTAVMAEHHVLVLSGLGINPRYVRQSLPLETLPALLQKVRGGKPGDPNRSEDRRAFIEQFDRLSKEQKAAYRDAIHRKTFSICHDFSNSGSLEVSDLRTSLTKATRYFDEVKRDDRFEMILFHVGAAGFVEVLFELDGLARVFIGSAERLPDNGLPFAHIIKAWDSLLQTGEPQSNKVSVEPLAHRLAREFLSTIRQPSFDDEYGRGALETIVAANLDTLDEVARVLDALTVALLHSLGDWHVLDAACQAIQSFTSSCVESNEISETTPERHAALDDIEFVPAVDLFRFLDAIEKSFADKLNSSMVPSEFGQRERLQKLYKLIRKTVAHLHSSKLLPNDSESGSLLITNDDTAEHGLSILLPPLRSHQEIHDETGKLYSLATQSYSRLNFSRRVHWSALIGAIQMIHEKPHALWRVISSMLSDANGPARDAVLSRLISTQSVVSQMRGQFRSLGDSESLTMSFEVQDPEGGATKDLSRFQVRLEPSLGGGVVYQQDSRVYRLSLESTWRNLNGLLKASEPIDTLVARLRSLGASLGEDVIQDLVKPLEIERDGIVARVGEIPHLTLQMTREFMRFPWELMNDGRGMLCERYALGRQVFMESSMVRPTARRNSDLIRVLVIGDPEYTPEFAEVMSARGLQLSRLLSARAEATTVARSFELLSDDMAGVVECQVTRLIDQCVSMDDVRCRLREGGYDLIHYAGHAFFDAQDGDGSAWVLSDGLLHAREIRNTLARSQRPPWLIFANACEAGMEQGIQPGRSVDVTGLATACINHGVAAYIAPLWPVDDEIAKWLAVRFYRELVHERYSVGESLRRARCAIWERLQESGMAQTMPARTALTWSSFVLYGDPTSRLLQTLWTPTSRRETQKNVDSRDRTESRPANLQSASRFRSALAGQLSATIDFPSDVVLASEVNHEMQRSMNKLPVNSGTAGIKIELVERFGLHYWRTVDGDASNALRTLSPIGRILDDSNTSDRANRIRQRIASRANRERGVSDSAKVIKSWVLKRLSASSGKSLIPDLAERFDRLYVPEQQLFRYQSTFERKRVVLPSESRRQNSTDEDSCDWMRLDTCHGQMNRALLLIHTTCSNCSSMTQSFSRLASADRFHDEDETESLLNWMLRRYRAVMGFDYWTLAKTPEQNAELLLAQLPKSWRSGKNRNAEFTLDILCHGQGGLVARSLLERCDPRIRIRRVIMVGVPNGGGRLAEPANWGAMADLLLNQISSDSTGWLGRLSSLLCYLSALGVDDQIPGLRAMRAAGTSSFKEKAGRLECALSIVASNYMPDRGAFSLRSILSEMGEQSIEKFFSVPGDLIVDTASMWAIDHPSDWTKDIPGLGDEDVLLLNTSGQGPSNVEPTLQSSVHHLNYFCNRSVREFIRKKLESES